MSGATSPTRRSLWIPAGCSPADLGCSEGDLHFSSLRLVILIITKHFPFWGKVTPSCSVQQACWGLFGSVCCKPLAVGYLGYGLPTHAGAELGQWQKCHLAVAGLSNAAHSHGCKAECFCGPETGALVPCHVALFCLLVFSLCWWEEDLLCSQS